MTEHLIVTMIVLVGIFQSSLGTRARCLIVRTSVAVMIGLIFSGSVAAAGLEDATVPAIPAPQARITDARRPAILPALYATLGVMQAWDAHSTLRALKAGAREANPIAGPFAGNSGSMLGLKATTTVSTIFFAERVWKKNRVAAIVLMTAINGATAAVAITNMRNSRMAAGRQVASALLAN